MMKLGCFLFLSSFIFPFLEGVISEKVTGHEVLNVWINEGLGGLREYSAPAFITGTEGSQIDFPEPIIKYDIFDNLIKQFINLEKSYLAVEESWIGYVVPPIFSNSMHGFAQALCVDSTFTLIACGDIHGSIHSLLRILRYLFEMGMIDDNYCLPISCKFIFLGDYADRGRYGVEVWYTLLRLKLANPGKVFLIRGNHEMIALAKMYGFTQEIEKKYNLHDRSVCRNTEKTLNSMFSLLPEVLFVGCGDVLINFLQFCHGGLGVVYDSIFHRLDKIAVEPLLDDVAYNHKLLPMNFYLDHCILANSFMWGDFFTTVADFAHLPDSVKHGAIVFSRGGENSLAVHGSLIDHYFYEGSFFGQGYRVTAIIRGHQHFSGRILRLSTKYFGVSWQILSSGQEVSCEPTDSSEYPVFTIMSGAEGLGTNGEGFALIAFKPSENKWFFKPYSFTNAVPSA